MPSSNYESSRLDDTIQLTRNRLAHTKEWAQSYSAFRILESEDPEESIPLGEIQASHPQERPVVAGLGPQIPLETIINANNRVVYRVDDEGIPSKPDNMVHTFNRFGPVGTPSTSSASSTRSSGSPATQNGSSQPENSSSQTEITSPSLQHGARKFKRQIAALELQNKNFAILVANLRRQNDISKSQIASLERQNGNHRDLIATLQGDLFAQLETRGDSSSFSFETRFHANYTALEHQLAAELLAANFELERVERERNEERNGWLDRELELEEGLNAYERRVAELLSSGTGSGSGSVSSEDPNSLERAVGDPIPNEQSGVTAVDRWIEQVERSEAEDVDRLSAEEAGDDELLPERIRGVVRQNALRIKLTAERRASAPAAYPPIASPSATIRRSQTERRYSLPVEVKERVFQHFEIVENSPSEESRSEAPILEQVQEVERVQNVENVERAELVSPVSHANSQHQSDPTSHPSAAHEDPVRRSQIRQVWRSDRPQKEFEWRRTMSVPAIFSTLADRHAVLRPESEQVQQAQKTKPLNPRAREFQGQNAPRIEVKDETAHPSVPSPVVDDDSIQQQIDRIVLRSEAQRVSNISHVYNVVNVETTRNVHSVEHIEPYRQDELPDGLMSLWRTHVSEHQNAPPVADGDVGRRWWIGKGLSE